MRLLDWFRYALPMGIANLWRFRREVWHYRPWDYEYSYRLFLKALELQEQMHRNDDMHEGAIAEADAIALTRHIWYEYTDGWLERYMNGEMDAAAAAAYEQQRWDAFHDYLRDHARGWWV